MTNVLLERSGRQMFSRFLGGFVWFHVCCEYCNSCAYLSSGVFSRVVVVFEFLKFSDVLK